MSGDPISIPGLQPGEGGQGIDDRQGTGVLGAGLVNIAHNQDTGPPSDLYTFTLLKFLLYLNYQAKSPIFLAYSNIGCIFVQLWLCEHEQVSHVLAAKAAPIRRNVR